MIFISNYDGNLVSMIANESLLDSDMIQLLRDELTNDPTGRGYASMNQIDRLITLCTPYIETYTVPEVTEPIKEWPTDVLYNILLQANTPASFTAAPDTPVLIVLDEMRNDANPQIAGLAKLIWLTINSNLKAINLENPKVFAGIQALHQMGVISDALYKMITVTVISPEHTAERTMEPRSFVLLGSGYIPTVREVIEAGS